MTTAQHQKSVNSALRAGDELGRLFARVGGSDAPRGRILRAYRLTRDVLSVDEAVRRQSTVMATLIRLRDDVQAELDALLDDALALGAEQAGAQLRAYAYEEQAEDTAPGNAGIAWRETFKQAALLTIASIVTAQIGQVLGLLSTGAITAAQVIGDGVRVGILNPTAVIAQSRDAIAKATLAAWDAEVETSITQRNVWARQAVAAIDERTTDCCLRVHGQWVALDEDFELTGTPRFADELHAPPFHWNCRTAVALVKVTDVDDDLTQRMREAARRELAIRRLLKARGVAPRPVNAFGSGG